MKNRILGVVCLLAFLSPAAVAQFGGGIVFDPTQSGHAIAQIQQAQQLYTTALQTRNEIISTYNLVRQMANLPNSLYQYYVTPWTNWTNIYAVNTYGNVVGWVGAANTGYGANTGYQTASIGPAPRYPQYGSLSPESQQFVAAQGATNDLGEGVTESTLQTLGTMRADSEARQADIRQMEAYTYTSDPTQHTDRQRFNG